MSSFRDYTRELLSKNTASATIASVIAGVVLYEIGALDAKTAFLVGSSYVVGNIAGRTMLRRDIQWGSKTLTNELG